MSLEVPDRFILGWEEWLSLPDLGLPAIKAKIDTGAKTSALHAFLVEPFGPSSRPMVRFGVHPIPGRSDVEVFCTAPIADRRDVTSSNGDRETRLVITTTVEMGPRRWPIEVTLTNRESMAYRMLLGRQAIGEDMFVDPTSSFHQPRLGYKIYRPRLRSSGERRPLRIALLTRQPESASNRHLIRAIEARSHTAIIVDRTRVSLFVDTTQPAIFLDGKPLENIDAVIVRAGKVISSFSAAVVRQLQISGAHALNAADALMRAGDPLAVRQLLAQRGITVPEAAVSHGYANGRGAGSEGHILADSWEPRDSGPIARFAVLDGRAIAGIERDASTRTSLELLTPRWRLHEHRANDLARHVAERATQTLDLGIATVDLLLTNQEPTVVDVSTSIPIALFERVAETAIAEAIVVEIERRTSAMRGAVTPV